MEFCFTFNTFDSLNSHTKILSYRERYMQGENYTVCKYFSKLYYSKSHVFKDIRIMIYKFNMNWNYTVGFDTYSLKKEKKMKEQLRLLTFTVLFSL